MLQNRKSNRRVDPSAIGLLRRKSRKIYYLQLETLRMICIRFMKQPLTLHLNARIMKMDFLLKVSQFLKYSLPCMRAQDFKLTKLKIIQLPEKSDLQTGWKGGKKRKNGEKNKNGLLPHIYTQSSKCLFPRYIFTNFLSYLRSPSFHLPETHQRTAT